MGRDPVEGEEEPPAPAPMVTLVAAEDEQGAADSESQEGQDQEVALQNTSAPTDADDGGAATGLVIAALIVGGLGLIAGLAGLLTARRRPTA